jgi:hydrogenase maturation protease
VSAPASQVKTKSLVEKIAGAVLYEGYILYPYRPSAVKNQQRWNFGVLCPEPYAIAQRGTESSTMRTECLIEVDRATTVDVRVRFLHLLLREVGGDVSDSQLPRTWQEAVERDVLVPQVKLCEAESPHRVRFDFPASSTSEPLIDPVSNEKTGSIIRTQSAITGEVEIVATDANRQLAIGNRQLKRLSVIIRNLTAFEDADKRGRDEALLRSFVSTHTILEAQRGAFVSLLDPPDRYKAAAAECVNTGTYPVLVGDEVNRDCVLSSPIILYDYPQIAPESAGDLFDGTEIDEILTLRIMSLTDDEKREMRSADALARQLLERTESMSAEQLLGLHGVMKKS